MFNLFGFDPAKLTDDELTTKQMEINRRLVWAGRFGSGELVEQLQLLAAAIDFERRERFVRYQVSARQNMFPDVIETDPDLQQEPAKETKQDTKSAPQRRPALVRTTRPITAAQEATTTSQDKK